MKEKIEQIRQQALAAIEDAAGMDKLNDVKVAFLGKKGQLSSLLKGMKDVAPEDRPKVGQMVNEARAGIEEKMEEKRTAIQKKLREAYYEAKIFENDPFAKLDQTGVGLLMEMAIEKGKKVRPSLHCGICGEHGGDPTSVEFCDKIGLDYVSCSPFRVPIARLAAAQAAIKSR